MEKGEVACASSGKAGKASSTSMPLLSRHACQLVFVLANIASTACHWHAANLRHVLAFRAVCPYVWGCNAKSVHCGTGGFLAMDWCDGGPVGPLARLSYSLHKTLASELGQDTGYREVRTYSVAASAKPGDPPLSCTRSRSVHLAALILSPSSFRGDLLL